MDAAALRDSLVEDLRAQGCVRSRAVATAMRTVPRERFTPPGLPLEQAYADRVVVLAEDASGEPISTVSQPAMVALMLEQLAVAPGHRVLEIGTGSGYNAALLAVLTGPGGRVTSVEVDPHLAPAARRRLAALAPATARGPDGRSGPDGPGGTAGPGDPVGPDDPVGPGGVIGVVTGDGWAGVPRGAPYDRIESTVGVSDVPPAWAAQLTPDGILVVPLALRPGIELSVAFVRGPDRTLTGLSVRPCGFLQLRGPHAGPGRSARLAPGVLVAGDNLGPGARELLAALLALPPADHGPAAPAPAVRRAGLLLADERTVFVWRDGSAEPAWGVLVRGPRAGLGLVEDGRTVSYGAPEAARELTAALAAAPDADPARLTVRAWPADADAGPPPPGAWDVPRRWWRYRVTTG